MARTAQEWRDERCAEYEKVKQADDEMRQEIIKGDALAARDALSRKDAAYARIRRINRRLAKMEGEP